MPTPDSICLQLEWVDACGGDHHAAIVLTQLAAWHHEPGAVRRTPRADGAWFVPTAADWHATTRLDESTLRRALSGLVQRGLVLTGRWKLDGESVRHVRLANPEHPTISTLPPEQASLLEHPAARPRTAADDERFAEAERLCNLLADLIAGNGVKRPNVTATWIADMEKIIRIDEREPAKIERAIRWVQGDSFWAPNVMCPAKLRAQYPRLQLQAKNGRGRPAATHRPAAQDDLAASYGKVRAS